MKSLHAIQHTLSHAENQIDILEHGSDGHHSFTPFQYKLETIGLYPLKPLQTATLQINVGKMCNQTCNHCHVDAGPDRKEIMSKDTMIECLKVLQANPSINVVDITGGAPEMNPHFRWLVEEIKKMGRQVIVRCNLTIILANKKYHDLPIFYKKYKVELISSLPCYTQENTDQQRGDGVFNQSIQALQMLNEVGYGMEGSGLTLHLVYNPVGASLAGDQSKLEHDYKEALKSNFGIHFNHLYTITNLPINRFLDYLLKAGKYEAYMEKLVHAFNPQAAAGVMCRDLISVGWDGYLYDCDFNQMLEMKVESKGNHISQYNTIELMHRDIVVNQHCYGCTAGAGSSCGGAITK